MRDHPFNIPMQHMHSCPTKAPQACEAVRVRNAGIAPISDAYVPHKMIKVLQAGFSQECCHLSHLHELVHFKVAHVVGATDGAAIVGQLLVPASAVIALRYGW